MKKSSALATTALKMPFFYLDRFNSLFWRTNRPPSVCICPTHNFKYANTKKFGYGDNSSSEVWPIAGVATILKWCQLCM